MHARYIYICESREVLALEGNIYINNRASVIDDVTTVQLRDS